MRRAAYTILAVVLILNSLSLFGAAFMDHSTHVQCPFSVMFNNNCETVGDANAATFHHIDAFKSLTEVFPASSVSILAMLLLVAVAVSISKLLIPKNNTDQVIQRLGTQQKFLIPIKDALLMWLTLQNKRATHLLSWRVVA